MRHVETRHRACPGCGGSGSHRYSTGIDYEYHTSDDCFSFIRCEGCGLVYLDPAPISEEMGKIYPAEYKPFHFGEAKKGIILSARNLLETRKARDYVPLVSRDARIIDVGCGDGRYVSLLRRVNPSWRLEGIDFNEAAVNRARSRGISAIVGDYERTPLTSKSYDLIILNQVLEHFADPARAIEKIREEAETWRTGKL